jgi:hypothetical protein
MKQSEFIKLNFKFEISNFCANVKVKITSPRTAVRQLANTLTVREFSKWIVCLYKGLYRVRVGIEESILNARISCLNLTSVFALFVFLHE